jgi:hypothetical protein
LTHVDEGRFGELTVTVDTGDGKAAFVAPKEFRRQLRECFPEKMGLYVANWLESLAVALAATVPLYIAVAWTARRCGLGQDTIGLLGMATAAIGFVLVLGWRRRPRP